jgi:hypothetical protein
MENAKALPFTISVMHVLNVSYNYEHADGAELTFYLANVT